MTTIHECHAATCQHRDLDGSKKCILDYITINAAGDCEDYCSRDSIQDNSGDARCGSGYDPPTPHTTRRSSGSREDGRSPSKNQRGPGAGLSEKA